MDGVSKTQRGRLDVPQLSVEVHEEYQVVDNMDLVGRAAMGVEDTGSSVVD